MKPLFLAVFVFAAALYPLAPQTASAQGRDSIYAVGGVQVDETAANAAAAREAGFAQAQRRGFERLVRRLTIPAEIASVGAPAPDALTLERLVLSVDVDEERRSSTRYIGRLTVRFDPAGVRALLRQSNLTVVESRAPPVLVAALAAPDAAPETSALWRQVWSQGGFAFELAPLPLAPETLQGPPAWPGAAPFAQAAGAQSVLYATLRVQGALAAATVVEVDANSLRDRGEVSARIGGGDPAAMRAALASLAEQISARFQDEWKARAPANSGQRGRLSASAIYRDEAQWEQIKDALEAAAQTIISEIRIEAVGRDGALVSFSFSGDQSQLVAELGRRGVRLENTAYGPTLRVAQR